MNLTRINEVDMTTATAETKMKVLKNIVIGSNSGSNPILTMSKLTTIMRTVPMEILGSCTFLFTTGALKSFYRL